VLNGDGNFWKLFLLVEEFIEEEEEEFLISSRTTSTRSSSSKAPTSEAVLGLRARGHDPGEFVRRDLLRNLNANAVRMKVPKLF
jgi:hypothetical protein